MKKALYLLLINCLALACTNTDTNSIHCTLTDYFTREPIPNVTMTFDVASPGILFGSNIAKGKYTATSDENGRFTLENVESDISNRFYAEFTNPDEQDSLKPEWRYLTRGSNEDSIWIVKGVNHSIRLKPSGCVTFHHPSITNSQSVEDTILIATYNQTDTISLLKPKSTTFYALPSANQTITLTYRTKGKSTQKLLTVYIPRAYTTEKLATGTITHFNQNVIDIPGL